MMMKRISFVLVCLLMVSISAKAQHKLGEIIDFNGVKGMVFLVDADGEHGLAMSVKKCSENWLADKEAKFETSSFYEDDGEKNMKAIENYIKEQNQQWEDFPFFKFCHELGEGWYAPANEELTALINFINNGDGMKYKHKNIKELNKILRNAGGDALWGALKTPALYFSSTEAEKGYVYAMVFEHNIAHAMSPAGMFGTKGRYVLRTVLKAMPGGKALSGIGSRAVHKF